jgi:hypothetical protein
MRPARLLLIVPVVVVVWPVAASAQSAGPAPVEAPDQIAVSGTVDVPRGEAVGEVVVISGRVTIDGVAHGDVVVFQGNATVRGEVDGSVIAADGVIRLGRSARVGGDVVSGDEVRAADGAAVGGALRQHVRFSLEGPLAALGSLLGPAAVVVSVLLAGLALLAFVPRGADAVADTLTDAPLASLGWGILLAVGAPITAVALSVLVLGLPLGLALLFSLGLWWLAGLTFAAWCAGRALVRTPHGRYPAFLAGWAILAAVSLVPVLNVAVWTLPAAVGLGAALVTAWRAGGGRQRGRHRKGGSREAPVEAGIL